MANANASDLIQKSLQVLGVLGDGETASANQTSDGLDFLNLMLASWSQNSLLTSAEIQEIFTLSIGTATYSIGSNQTFNTEKPISVLSAFLRDGTSDYPISIISRELYDQILSKDDTGIPERVFYDAGATQQANQAGTLKFYPVPDKAYSLYLKMEKDFSEIAAANSTITFKNPYKLPIIYNLAILQAPLYGIQVTPEIAKVSEESLNLLINVNARNKEEFSRLSFPGSVSSVSKLFD